MTALGPRIAVGTRSTVHLFGSSHVAKVPLAGTPDAWIRHEALFTEAVRAAGAPAPESVDLIEVDGRIVSVYERISGASMWEHVCAHPADAAAMGRLLGELHVRLSALVPPVVLPRQRDRLVCKIRRAATIEPSLIEAIGQIPGQTGPVQLCHGDFHPGNVILSPDGPVLIDWFDACRGDAAGDAARSSLLMGCGGATDRTVPHLPGATNRVVREVHDAFVARVISAAGSDESSMWLRIEAAARLGEGLMPDELLAVWRRGADAERNLS